MANPSVPYVQTSEAVVGEGHPLLPDVVNRPLKQVLAWSGAVVGAGFSGLMPAFNPMAYGATGDGVTDDSLAIQQCLDAARASVTSTWQIPRVDFGGLSYLIGTQLQLPGGNGMVLTNGRLVASPTFDTSKYLIEVGQVSDAYLPDGFKINNLTVRDMYFDSSHRGGGLLIQRFLRARVDGCTFVGYSTCGLRTAVDGHELMVTACQFGEYLWGDTTGTRYDRADLFVGTGIRFETNDNHVTDTVIQLSRYGIYLANSDANLFNGVHIWPGYVKTAGTSGATSALDWINTCVYVDQNSQLNNFTGCYFDGGQFIWENPWKASITNSIFLHGWGDASKGMIVFKAMAANVFLDGVQITGNTFSVTNTGATMKALQIDTSAGTFSAGNITRCRWTDNAFSFVTKFYSEVNLTLSQNAQDWTWDLYNGGAGLFPFNVIQQQRYSTYQFVGGTSHFRTSALSNAQITISSYSDAAIGTKQTTNATVYLWASLNKSDS